MKISVKLTVICTLHSFYITFGQMAKGTSRCDAPTAELTKEATVTCIFPVDVRLSKTDFDVYHEKEKVAACMWVRGIIDCTQYTGYEQDDQMVTNSFTLRIPYFLQNYTGRYSCILDGYDTEECSLSKRTVPATSRDARQQKGTAARLKASEDVTSNDEKTANTVLIIVVPTLSACLVVAIAAVVMHFVCKRFRIKRKARKPDKASTLETRGDDKEYWDIQQVEEKKTDSREHRWTAG